MAHRCPFPIGWWIDWQLFFLLQTMGNNMQRWHQFKRKIGMFNHFQFYNHVFPSFQAVIKPRQKLACSGPTAIQTRQGVGGPLTQPGALASVVPCCVTSWVSMHVSSLKLPHPLSFLSSLSLVGVDGFFGTWVRRALNEALWGHSLMDSADVSAAGAPDTRNPPGCSGGSAVALGMASLGLDCRCNARGMSLACLRIITLRIWYDITIYYNYT